MTWGTCVQKISASTLLQVNDSLLQSPWVHEKGYVAKWETYGHAHACNSFLVLIPCLSLLSLALSCRLIDPISSYSIKTLDLSNQNCKDFCRSIQTCYSHGSYLIFCNKSEKIKFSTSQQM